MGKLGKTCCAKLLTVSNSDLQQNCYRPVQKLTPFKIVTNNKISSNENHEGHCNNERPARRAAVEGQQLRKIRGLHYCQSRSGRMQKAHGFQMNNLFSYTATLYFYLFIRTQYLVLLSKVLVNFHVSLETQILEEEDT